MAHHLKQAANAVGKRSLFIRVDPAPANLSERRAVLRVIQKYGEIEMFKQLADDRSFISIASSTDTVTDLIKRSPLCCEFTSENSESINPWQITPPIQPVEKPVGAGQTYGRSQGQARQKSFVLSIFPSENYQHRSQIRHSPLHGPWPDGDEHKSFVYNALRDVVPKDSLGAEAFCDWETGSQLSNDARIQRSDNKILAHIEDRHRRRRHAGKSTLDPLSEAPKSHD